MKRVLIAFAFLVVLAAGGIGYQLFVLKAAEPSSSRMTATPAVPVMVAAVERAAIPVRIDAIGAVQPIASVAVKSRVDGQIAEVKIADGQSVKAGDVLFVLDTRSALAQLKQAEANLTRDHAQLDNARRDVARFKAAHREGIRLAPAVRSGQHHRRDVRGEHAGGRGGGRQPPRPNSPTTPSPRRSTAASASSPSRPAMR